MRPPTANDLARALEADGGPPLLWVSRDDLEAPGAAGVLAAAPDGARALALVLCGDDGLATLLELDEDAAGGLHDALAGWLEDRR